MKLQRHWIAKAILGKKEKKDKNGDIAIPDSKVYHKATIIKVELLWQNNNNKQKPQQASRPMLQNRKPIKKFHAYTVTWSSTKRTKKAQWRKLVSSTNGVGKIGYPYAKEKNWTQYYTIYKDQLKMN